MSESGYYPPGAEHDPRAPYNEVEGDVCPDCDGTGDEAAGPGATDCKTCNGTGVVDPPTREDIEEARAEARFDQLHEEGRI